MDPSLITLVTLGTPLLTIGAAWGGAKVALNGTRNRVKQLESDAVMHRQVTVQQHVDTVDRLARVETKLDTLIMEKR